MESTRGHNGLTFSDPGQEYLDWASKNSLDVVFFDQNYQFSEIEALKRSGVKTIGRYVWESFKECHVTDARSAFNVIYSLTRCEQERYKRLGIDSPFLPWGCHPELLKMAPQKKNDAIYFFYPGGYLSKRKPSKATIEAFHRVQSPDVRLIIKTQTESRLTEHIGEAAQKDSRIHIVTDDLDTEDYYRLFSSCHVCLAPSRWEGLGLHLFESVAFGMPVITNDAPPMNEIVINEFNGLNVFSYFCGLAESGVPAVEPSIKHLASTIERMSKPEVLQFFEENTKEMRKRLAWGNTVQGFKGLLEN